MFVSDSTMNKQEQEEALGLLPTPRVVLFQRDKVPL